MPSILRLLNTLEIEYLAGLHIDESDRERPPDYVIELVDHGPYVDCPIKAIYMDGGQWVFDTSCYTGKALSSLRLDQVRVAKVEHNWHESV